MGLVKNVALKVYYFNARSIRNKIIELQAFLDKEVPDILALSETWLSPNDQFIVRGYNVCRCDRLNKIGGGVAILVHENLKFVPIKLPNLLLTEATSIKIVCKEKSFQFSVLYNPPACKDEHLNELDAIFKSLESTDCHNVIVGDFNFPRINWKDLCVTNSCSISETFLSLVNEYGYSQLVFSSTHVSFNVLDLVLSSSSNIVSILQIHEPFSAFDHSVLSFQVSSGCREHSTRKKYPNYAKMDVWNFRKLFAELPWHSLFDQNTAAVQNVILMNVFRFGFEQLLASLVWQHEPVISSHHL